MSTLVKCKGCKKEISKNAKSCPSCGEPVSKSSSLFGWLVGIIVLMMVISSFSDKQALSKEQNPQKSTQKAPDSYRIMKTQETLAKRLKDSDSAKYGKIYVGKDGAVCGSVNAKNSLGGYTGYKQFVGAGSLVFFEDDQTIDEWRKTWNTLCTSSNKR